MVKYHLQTLPFSVLFNSLAAVELLQLWSRLDSCVLDSVEKILASGDW